MIMTKKDRILPIVRLIGDMNENVEQILHEIECRCGCKPVFRQVLLIFSMKIQKLRGERQHYQRLCQQLSNQLFQSQNNDKSHNNIQNAENDNKFITKNLKHGNKQPYIETGIQGVIHSCQLLEKDHNAPNFSRNKTHSHISIDKMQENIKQTQKIEQIGAHETQYQSIELLNRLPNNRHMDEDKENKLIIDNNHSLQSWKNDTEVLSESFNNSNQLENAIMTKTPICSHFESNPIEIQLHDKLFEDEIQDETMLLSRQVENTNIERDDYQQQKVKKKDVSTIFKIKN